MKTKSKSKSVNTPGSNGDLPIEHMIAEAAYYHAEKRGFTPENDLGDWLQAEADVKKMLGQWSVD